MSEHNWIENAGEQGAEFTGTLTQIKGELGIGDDTVEETLLMSLYYSPESYKTKKDIGGLDKYGLYLGDVNILDSNQFQEIEVRHGLVDPSAFFGGETVSKLLFDSGQRGPLESSENILFIKTDQNISDYAKKSEIVIKPASDRAELRMGDLDDDPINPFGEDDV